MLVLCSYTTLIICDALPQRVASLPYLPAGRDAVYNSQVLCYALPLVLALEGRKNGRFVLANSNALLLL